MRVKDKMTKKILSTNSVWLIKKWLNNPKRYTTKFEEEIKTETPKPKKVEKDKKGDE